jgi:hypothetical protein
VVVGGQPDALSLAVSARIDSKCAFPPHLCVLNPWEVDALGLEAIDVEVIDLAQIVPLQDLRVGMVRVRAACSEAPLESSRLALDSREPLAFVDYEVVARVLPKGNEYRVAGAVKRDHDRELRPIADRLRVLHTSSVPQASAGAVSESDNIMLAYHVCSAGVAQG